ncbi:hypothetical protein L1281_001681 [Neisseria sp. HSC-16F19]|nr:SMI1/KNR4 family protein [Neisseria sp. HSC-16F19]MCP2041087.1 hypothetical protein [Neisseria sp. HSC-16F19]
MNDSKDIETTFTALCEGRLDAEEWLAWFAEHQAELEQTLNRRRYLGIKPMSHCSANRNAAAAQADAQKYLAGLGIEVALSDIYEQAWEREFAAWCAEQRREEKARQAAMKEAYGYVAGVYPKLFKALLKATDVTIRPGADEAEIARAEDGLGVALPEDIRRFFRLMGGLRLEGVMLDIAELGLENFLGRDYVVLGEFWKYGDGDALLYDPAKAGIYVYAHGYPKVIREAADMDAFAEKRLAAYVRGLGA